MPELPIKRRNRRRERETDVGEKVKDQRDRERTRDSFIKTTTDISLSIPRFLCYL